MLLEWSTFNDALAKTALSIAVSELTSNSDSD